MPNCQHKNQQKNKFPLQVRTTVAKRTESLVHFFPSWESRENMSGERGIFFEYCVEKIQTLFGGEDGAGMGVKQGKGQNAKRTAFRLYHSGGKRRRWKQKKITPPSLPSPPFLFLFLLPSLLLLMDSVPFSSGIHCFFFPPAVNLEMDILHGCRSTLEHPNHTSRYTVFTRGRISTLFFFFEF